MLDGNTQDGRQYVDGQGVIQEYDLETKAYVNKGVIKVPPLVNEQTDGLIFPKLFDRLRLIETYADWLKANIKLETSLLPFPYFYFLDSSDDLIRFYGEDVQTLRIEVDRGRLFQKILRNFCVGGLGDVGAEGERGAAGKPAAKERKVSTKFSDVEATFSTEIGIPLDTAISIRLYDKYDQKISEIIIELIGSSGGTNGGITILNYTEDLLIDPASIITLGVDSQLTALSIQAEIKLSKGKFDKHYFKARQTGPQGEDGSDGTNFLEVRTKNDGDASIVATSAIVNVRKSATTTDMFYRKQSLAENACVAGLTPVNGLPRDVIENALWVSLLPTARECKDIVYERFTPVISEPPLNLPYWTPMKQCADRLRFTIAKFEWQDQITPENRCGVLPFNILTDPRPPEHCCVAAGTFIHCFDGLRPIESLRVGDKVLCPDGIYRPIEKFFDNGIKSCVEAIFSDGSKIVATEDHKIPVGGVLKEISKLTKIDQVQKAPSSLEHLKRSNFGTDDDFEEGYIIGYLLGDGWISNKRIGIVQHDVDEESFLKCHKFLSKRFGKVSIRSKKIENGHLLSSIWESKKAREYFINKGWYKNNREKITTIPNSFYSSSYKFYQGFFSAMISTDGCITKHGEVNVDHSSTQEIPTACKLVLDYLGFQSTLKKQKQSKTSRFKGNGWCFRTDVLRQASHSREFAEFISATEERKLKHLNTENTIAFQANQKILNIDPSRDGTLAGIFTFFGGYNPTSNRAWLNLYPASYGPTLLKVGFNIKTAGQRSFHKILPSLKECFKAPINDSFAVGFLKVMLDYKDFLTPRGRYLISRNDVGEATLIKKCLDQVDCHYTFSFSRLMKSKNQTQQILLRRSSDVYRLFTLTGKQDALSRLKSTSPQQAVTMRNIKPMGPKHVYDFAVSPHFLMMANGLILNDCQQDLFHCANVGDACPMDVNISVPVRFEEEECPCDCTPRTDPMLFSGETVTNVYPCSINGKMHEYRQELEILNITETKIIISVTKGTFCDDDEYTKFKVDPCPIKTNVIPTCLSDEMTQNPDGILTISDFGSTTLTISGTGTLRLDVQVNLDAAVCCQGYNLTIRAEAIQVEPTPGPGPLPPVPPTSSASSRSSSSSGSSSSSSTSSSSSSSFSSSPAVRDPQIILTISGLYGGDTYLGLGNGVHTVSPVFYLPASPEIWAGGTYNEHLVLYANSYYPYSNVRFRKLLGTTAWDGLWAGFYTSNYYVSSHYLTSYYFPFTSGSITSKIKNRCFGQLSTSSRITISWQRAPNWPSNPPVPSYTITPSAGANGTIAPSTAQVVNQGGSRLFTITPSPGYKISDVLVDGGSVGAVPDYTFTGIAADHTIAASFVVDPVPQMLLTISNLPIGQTYFGLWNGVYAVTPTFYQAAPYEVWYRSNAWDYMLANANPFGGRTSAWVATMWGSVHATFFNTYYAATSVSLSSFYFPFTLGSVTTKIKNRAFGTITTTSGGIISWQRAPNWPSNP